MPTLRTYANTAKRGSNTSCLIVILHNIRSVYNVGSIFRTCDGAGVKKIYLVGATPTPFNRFGDFRKDFKKVSLGAEKTVEWKYVKNFSAVYRELKLENYKVLAVEQDKRAIPYYEFDAKRKIRNGAPRQVRDKNQGNALIFGEETKGLPKTVLDRADKILEIPMRGAMVRQAHHPKNLGNKSLDNARSKPLDATRGKESLNVSVAAGVVIYRLAIGSE